MIRTMSGWLFLALLFGGVLLPARITALQQLTLEPGTDRPGDDYRSFDVASARVADCQQACTNEARCVAFTYINPGIQGKFAKCLLKAKVPRPVRNSCCTSGVKTVNRP